MLQPEPLQSPRYLAIVFRSDFAPNCVAGVAQRGLGGRRGKKRAAGRGGNAGEVETLAIVVEEPEQLVFDDRPTEIATELLAAIQGFDGL